MIKITYNRDMPRVTIEGHAGSGEAGHDLVCASVSILAYTLTSFILNVSGAGFAHNAVADLKEGDAVISCEPYESHKNTIKLVFGSICAGFEILAHEYPSNISLEII